MTHHTRLINRFAVVAAPVLLTIAVAGIAAGASAASAQTLHLSGRLIPGATGTTTITRVGQGNYRVQISIRGLPQPTTLHVQPLRHVYLGWAYNGSAYLPIQLKLNNRTRAYTGSRVLRYVFGSRIFITSDQRATQTAPTAPEVDVLTT